MLPVVSCCGQPQRFRGTANTLILDTRPRPAAWVHITYRMCIYILSGAIAVLLSHHPSPLSLHGKKITTMCLFDQTPYIGCPEGEQHFYQQWMKCNKAVVNGQYCPVEKSALVEELRDFSGNVLCCPIHRHIAVHQHQFSLIQGDFIDAAASTDGELVDLTPALDRAIQKQSQRVTKDKPRPPKIAVAQWTPRSPIQEKETPLSPRSVLHELELVDTTEPPEEPALKPKVPSRSPSGTSLELSSGGEPELEPVAIAQALIEMPPQPRAAEPKAAVPGRSTSPSQSQHQASRPGSSQRRHRDESTVSAQGRRRYREESTQSSQGRRRNRDHSATSSQRTRLRREETPEPDCDEPVRGRKPLQSPSFSRRGTPDGIIGLPSRPDMHRQASMAHRNTGKVGSIHREIHTPAPDSLDTIVPTSPTSRHPDAPSPASYLLPEADRDRHSDRGRGRCAKYTKITKDCDLDNEPTDYRPSQSQCQNQSQNQHQVVPPLHPSRPASVNRHSRSPKPGPNLLQRRRTARDRDRDRDRAHRTTPSDSGLESPTLGLSVHWDLPNLKAPISTDLASPTIAAAGPAAGSGSGFGVGASTSTGLGIGMGIGSRAGGPGPGPGAGTTKRHGRGHMKRESDDSGYQSIGVGGMGLTRKASRELPLRVDWEREKELAREREREREEERETRGQMVDVQQPPPQQCYQLPAAALSPRPLPDAAYVSRPATATATAAGNGHGLGGKKKSLSRLRRTLSGFFNDGRKPPG